MQPLPPRIPLSPTARKLVAAAALTLGVVIVGRTLGGDAPRETEFHLALRDGTCGQGRPRALEVTLSRGAEALRSFQIRNLGGSRELRETVSVPAGTLRARVALTCDDVVLEREGDVTVRAGERTELPHP